jgi:hypothetical protein
MLMRKITVRKIWILAFLLTGFTSGCGLSQTAVVSPTVTATVPADGATGVPAAQVVTATFSKAMNPTTINAATFGVIGPGGSPLAGTVTYAGTTATFTPAVPLAGGTLYTGAVSTAAKDPVGTGLVTNFVWSFTTGTVPTVTSTNPLNGAINVPISQKITATFSEAMNSATVIAPGTFTVSVAGAGGAAVPGTVTYVALTNTATFAPTANLLPSTQYTATINTSAQSAPGNALASNSVWSFTTGKTVDATPPTVSVTIPASGATGVLPNQTISATFSKVMDPATITASGTFTVVVAGVGGAAVPGTVSYAGSTATFTPTANLAASTQFTATITNAAKDLSGNALIAGAVPNPWNFTTAAGSNAAPTVIAAVPANGATGVPVAQIVTATFSKAMNATTINTSTFGVIGPGGSPLTGTVTYSGTTATFAPATLLTGGTLYTAAITTGAKDPAGNSLASNVVWSFTTGTIPTVSSTNPLNGAINVPISQKITATFSEAMNSTTVIAPGTFTVAVAGAGGAAVPGTVTYVALTNTATFSPTANLLPSTQYTATMNTSAQSAAGNALASIDVRSFTTGVTPDVTPPTVSVTIPASAATTVPANQKITATFSKVMDPATVTASGTFTVAVAGAGGAAVPGTVSYAGSTATFTRRRIWQPALSSQPRLQMPPRTLAAMH